jgi:hypothetical protein
MLRVPELAHSAVCNSSERAASRRSPVSRQDRLPYHKHSYLSPYLNRILSRLADYIPPETDPRRVEFNKLHHCSVMFGGAMLLLGLAGMYLLVREITANS